MGRPSRHAPLTSPPSRCPCERDVQTAPTASRLEEHCGASLPMRDGERDLSRAAVPLERGRELIKRCRPLPRQQRQRGVVGTGLELRLRRGQCSLSASSRFGRQFGGLLEEGGRGGQTTARLSPPSRALESAATSSSGSGAARARCQARRSGSTRVGRVRERLVDRLRSSTGADGRRGAHQGMTKPHLPPKLEQTGIHCRLHPACGTQPEPLAARHTSAGSPVGRRPPQRAAGAVSRSGGPRSPLEALLDAARQRQRVQQPEAPRQLRGRKRTRGSSISASGLPRVSATIRSRTRSSRRQWSADSSSARASSREALHHQVRDTLNGSSSLDWRVAKNSATDSAKRRRATNASVSPMHDRATGRHPPGTPTAFVGRLREQAQHRQTDEKWIRRVALAEPQAVPSASRCGTGRCSIRSSIVAHNWCNRRSEFHLRLHTRRAHDPTSRRSGSAYSSSADLPIPGSPRARARGSHQRGLHRAAVRAARSLRCRAASGTVPMFINAAPRLSGVAGASAHGLLTSKPRGHLDRERAVEVTTCRFGYAPPW